jgi:hypothetical protein
VYFDFIKNAQISDGRFVNEYSGLRKHLEEVGSEDSFGRTLWSLGEYLNETGKGEEVSYNALNALDNFCVGWPASESFALLGLTKMYDVGFEKKRTRNLIMKLSNSLIKRKENNSERNWSWVSDEMSYENARVPLALFRSSRSLNCGDYFYHSKSLTDFLDKTVFEKDGNNKSFLNVVGNNTSGLEGTWYKKGSVKPEFDEQPVDAGGMVELHSEIYDFTRNKENFEKAMISFDWFNGKNRLNKKMISLEGGVYDGLGESDINFNQGAESLLAYLMAGIKFDGIKNGI